MIVKIAVVAIVCYVLYRLFMNDSRKKAEKEAADTKKKVAAGEMVQDPVCGTYVDRDSAITVKNGDRILYFCSYECRKKYLEMQDKQEKIS